MKKKEKRTLMAVMLSSSFVFSTETKKLTDKRKAIKLRKE